MKIINCVLFALLILINFELYAEQKINAPEIKMPVNSSENIDDINNDVEIIFKCYDQFYNREYHSFEFHYLVNKGVVQVRGKDAPNKCMDLYKSPDKFMNVLKILSPATFSNPNKRILLESYNENQNKIVVRIKCEYLERRFNKPQWINDICDENLIKIIKEGLKKQEELYKIKLENERKQADILKAENKKLFKFDVVSKVLNYSSGMGDDGDLSRFWYAEDSSKCIYKFMDDNKNNIRTLNLNELDSRLIKINVSSNKSLVLYDGGQLLTGTSVVLDPERLNRGWSLIYSKFCKSKQKEF
jgi:hypothetical protein